ncbi:response regulator [Paenibacillus eucommiae]|uniref:Two-component system response regulator YesN n=1 Tax=Paenibacillus eucommiae TaxID=1355755 RepID=A0ABS4IZY6_9BACL|nr:response regulator [Paenibacillus eucommiae]MBP1993157.1 two-component system response regulator YesN [Paenibacillus eucommiae]
MLKTLIVDDDKLVRKGLILTMPWTDFGMKVVGEANNGVKALEFLGGQEVDLLVTDLEMPVMSGIELMKQVKAEYPHIWMVVLTFHQDFDNIQQALRIGAIDYIAKVQLEQERMEEVLARIANRIREERMQSGVRQSLTEGSPEASGSTAGDMKKVLVFASLLDKADPQALQAIPFVRTQPLSGIGFGLWALKCSGALPEMDEDVLRRCGLEREWAILHVRGAGGGQHDWHIMLHAYKEHDFFYDYEPERSVYDFVADQPTGDGPQMPADADMRRIREGWSSLFWVTDDVIYEQLLAETQRLRPSVPLLESIFYSAAAEWKRILPDSAIPELGSQRPFAYWVNAVEWLHTVRSQLRGKLRKTYSDEVLQSVMKAVSYIREHFNQELRLADAAREANISRSYFSQCFKDIIGQSFNDYVRSLRIAHAEVLLQQTANPIYWVAEQCGYENEKYFSRVFSERVGMLPSEYRQRPRPNPK